MSGLWAAEAFGGARDHGNGHDSGNCIEGMREATLGIALEDYKKGVVSAALSLSRENAFLHKEPAEDVVLHSLQ